MAITTSPTDHFKPFPPEAQAVLDPIYKFGGLGPEQVDERITALRRHFNLGNMVVAAGGGINDNKELLRALEFYALQMHGYLDNSSDEDC